MHPIKTSFSHSPYVAYALGQSTSITHKFNALLEEINPDVVHHHNVSLLGYNILKKKRSYVNLYTAHDFWLICQQNNLMKNGARICNTSSCFTCSLKLGKPYQFWRHLNGFSKTISEIDFLITPSIYLMNKIRENINVKTVAIPNFVPHPSQRIIPSDFSDFFLYAGSLENHKGLLNLIEIFKDANVNARLLIAGSGSLSSKIRETVRKCNLGDKIVLLGWADSNFLFRLLNDAHALLVP